MRNISFCYNKSVSPIGSLVEPIVKNPSASQPRFPDKNHTGPDWLCLLGNNNNNIIILLLILLYIIKQYYYI